MVPQDNNLKESINRFILYVILSFFADFALIFTILALVERKKLKEKLSQMDPSMQKNLHTWEVILWVSLGLKGILLLVGCCLFLFMFFYSLS
jgi:hypothetical protein